MISKTLFLFVSIIGFANGVTTKRRTKSDANKKTKNEGSNAECPAACQLEFPDNTFYACFSSQVNSLWRVVGNSNGEFLVTTLTSDPLEGYGAGAMYSCQLGDTPTGGIRSEDLDVCFENLDVVPFAIGGTIEECKATLST